MENGAVNERLRKRSASSVFPRREARVETAKSSSVCGNKEIATHEHAYSRENTSQHTGIVECTGACLRVDVGGNPALRFVHGRKTCSHFVADMLRDTL